MAKIKSTVIESTKYKWEDFRVEESFGVFKIERRIEHIKQSGYLWWKKYITTYTWNNIDKRGGILFSRTLNKKTYSNYKHKMGTFTDIESAMNKISELTERSKYHYFE